jgi:hypothetical protein
MLAMCNFEVISSKFNVVEILANSVGAMSIVAFIHTTHSLL